MSGAISLPYSEVKVGEGGREEEDVPIIEPKKYARNWSDYFHARQKEKQFALQLLNEAIKMLKVKTHGRAIGRPPYPLSDKLFLCIQKVLRWTTYDANEEFIEFANLKQWITSKPSPHSISDFMNDPQLAPILQQLLILTSTPMAQIEEGFSIDSTGLSTHDKSRWVKIRLEKKLFKDFKKIHTIVGNKTNIIVSALVTDATRGDSPLLIPLIEKMSHYFKVKEFCGDGAYSSRKNATAVVEKGAVPYFKIRKNARSLAKGHPAWNKMMWAFKKNEKNYLIHYHMRSNVETAYSMFKRKVSEYLVSKTTTAKINEAYCIAIVHNLYCLVNAVFCHDINLKFKN